MANLESVLISRNTQLWDAWKPNPQTQGIVDRVMNRQILSFKGPCAVQTEEQVLSIVKVVADNSDGVRLPDKKPRTRPVTKDGKLNFFGIGHEAAMPIYRKVAAQYAHLAIGAETMSGSDICSLAASGVLGFAWSGSRTQEQETLQELGRVAKATNTLMMIKNPLAPDHEMYIGMMENFIIGADYSMPFMACLRGEFPVLPEDKEKWRNKPNRDLLDALVKTFPELPIIIDPSHMVKPPTDEESKAKRLVTVVDLIRQGLEYGARGYLVEVYHPDHPSKTDPGENVFDLINLLDKYGLISDRYCLT